ncbi:MARCKS-related protein [Rhinoderma darwinii]|uniref:MARCKS-related protein n=1 Tax=Rhinoderma darwinii TaxID=43563 RepID=UPI003F667BBF
MGSTASKSQSADITTSKTAEQQENGHVKASNGDTLPKTNGDAAAANGSAEPITEEAGSGEIIEQAPPTNGEAKPEEPPGKQAKKKRFSFKKNFKLPFRKTKKDAAAVEAPSAGEDTAAPTQEEESTKPVESSAENAEPASPAENPDPESAAPAEEAAAQPEPAVTPPEQTPQSEESVPSTETPTEPQKEE